ncbi:hypothetical protein RRG08_004879 [Elysia crispata]|uniref:Uncharacterized protein n=1 Tax=Elysia crispata TaxID=231223 RepID=A0AAE0ZHU8_9GAST|nr:hypothetical protein RRG08_004879 [Elysia crispata]
MNWLLPQKLMKSPAGYRPRLSEQPRRLSSGSITSDAESDGTEPDPPVVRRGRRAAIYETKVSAWPLHSEPLVNTGQSTECGHGFLLDTG